MNGPLLDAQLNTLLSPNESLARYTAARLGGAAEWLYVARQSTEELAAVVSAAWQVGLTVRVLGGGANVLVADRGVQGLVVINRFSEIEFSDQWHSEDGCARNVAASGGTGLNVLAHTCAQHGYSGFEWAVSVPGTVGGGVVGNAGAHGTDMARNVCEVVVLDRQRGAVLMNAAELAFGYRTSALKQRPDRDFLVLLAMFSFTPDDPQAISARMEENNAYRKRTQPQGASLGSVFKNPTGDYAGRLIEAAGLKGHQIGTVQVSPVHANFFLNIGQATASDYYALMAHVRETVGQHFGVWLEPEVELIGEW
jgi:UDP-N-acetylmuramate dehydrogenase